MRRDGYFKQENKYSSKWNLQDSIEKWVYGYNKPTGIECLLGVNDPRQIRFDKMIDIVNKIDTKLDSLENENNVDYENVFDEDELLNYYGCFLRDVDD